jgi:hypothetical protein
MALSEKQLTNAIEHSTRLRHRTTGDEVIAVGRLSIEGPDGCEIQGVVFRPFPRGELKAAGLPEFLAAYRRAPRR